MRQRRALLPRRGAAIASVASIVALGGFAVVRPNPQCRLATEWANQQPETSFVALSDVAKYSRGWQVAILSRVTPQVRSRIWHEHYAEILRTDTTLTLEQRELVMEVDRKSDWYALGDRDAVGRELKKNVEPRIKQLFGADKQHMANTFYRLTPGVGDEKRLSPQPSMLTASLIPGEVSSVIRGVIHRLAPAQASAAKIPLPCDCVYDFACSPFSCVENDLCEQTRAGCGVNDNGPCLGRCE